MEHEVVEAQAEVGPDRVDVFVRITGQDEPLRRRSVERQIGDIDDTPDKVRVSLPS